MGQKVNPIGFRLGVNKDWESKWYAGKDYAKTLNKDIKIREYLEKKLKDAAVASITIERKKNLKKDVSFNVCDKYLIELFRNRGELEYFEMQFLRRKVSEAFWNALHIKTVNTSYKESKRYLYQLFAEPDVRSGMEYMDFEHMNVYKKKLCKMMKKKQVFIFYIVIKYIAPLIEKFIKR